MENKYYPIPEPEINPIASLVMVYKLAKGIEYDDRTWDAKHWGRSMKCSKELLAICKSYLLAKKCLEEMATKFQELDRSWFFETVLSHAHDWVQKRGERNDRANKQRFFDALAKQRSANASQVKGSLASGGEIIDSLGIIKVIGYDNGDEGREANSANGSVGG